MICPGCGAPDDQGCYLGCMEVADKIAVDKLLDKHDHAVFLAGFAAGREPASSLDMAYHLWRCGKGRD